MIRLFLIVLAWPLVVLALVSGWQWYREAFPEAPAPWTADVTVDDARARRIGRAALDRFERLAPAEQEAIVASLAGTVITPGRWIRQLRRADYEVICLGEMHEPDTRAFLADTFFRRYAVDLLLLEARPPELRQIQRRVGAGRDYTPLLDADIGAIIRRARSTNPAVRIHGIEETREQAHARRDTEGSRDLSLARNFWRYYEPGATHVVLYGALHCADEAGWFYRYLREQSPPRADVPMRSIRVLGENQLEALTGFLHFLDGIGIAPGDFVIADTGDLHPQLRDWFGLLNQYVLGRYDTLVVFRGTPARPAGTVTEVDDEARDAATPGGAAVSGDGRAIPVGHPRAPGPAETDRRDP